MDQAVEYLQMIHEAVLANVGTYPPDLMEFTRITAKVYRPASSGS